MSRKISHIVFYGALWGIVEATLGFGLHLLKRVAPIPGLTGYVLFPIGFFIMLAAVRSVDKDAAAFYTAAVAAGLKLFSGLLPGVDWIFVINPSLAILLEGLVVFLTVKLFSMRKSASAIFTTFAAAISWRALFLLAILILPLQAGILKKGTAAILQFLFLESAVNGILIGFALWLGVGSFRLARLYDRINAPVWSILALFVAVSVELLIVYVS